ncbi:hypothetical protein PC121_g11491 [Phytophthora cactorum]|nr:hypothetical protein PC120_g17949 [Phytophthora cactorum]KAG3065019.1 hypothetical protein PC121_g11491 [Phytophthora cactorum]KAG4043075.1 hypothetical protein PC123_g21456 [Phytophthora cactorum]
MVERGLPQEVEDELPRVVKRELSEEVDAVESRIPYPDADPISRCCDSVDMIKRGFSSSAAESRFVVVVDESRVDLANRLSVQRQLRPKGSRSWWGAATTTSRVYEKSKSHVHATSPAGLDADASASDTRTRLKLAEPKTVREARYATQSLPALEASGNPVAPLVREFIEIFPEKVPVVLPPDRGVRHEIGLTPGVKYCVTRQWPLPRDQTEAIDAFFQSRRRAGHVRESVSPHSSPTLCVKKATGGWRIVPASNKLNDATIPAQTPIPRKDMVLDTMSGCTQHSAMGLMDGFYQILMREDDLPLTIVITPSGMLCDGL